MEKSTLKKSVTVVETMAVIVGMIIGSDTLLKPGIVLRNAGSPAVSITAWITGGTITLTSALSAAEITSAIPRSGGLYAHLEELYDERAGFLLGWVQTAISYPASVTTQVIALSIYAAYFIPVSGIQQKLLVMGVLIFILVMNILSIKCGGITRTLAMVDKLILIVAIIGVGLPSPSSPGFAGSSQEVLQGAGFGAAILGTLRAYDDWVGVTDMVNELKNPSKTLSGATPTGVLFVIMIYALFNLAIFRTLPLDQVATSATPDADAANVLFGEGDATFITTDIMASTSGVPNDYLITTARVLQAMDERGQLSLSRVLDTICLKLRTLTSALIPQNLLAPVYIFPGAFNTLADLLVLVLWIFFTMGVLGALIPRKKQRPEGGKYRVSLYPITPIIGVMDGVYISTSTLINVLFRSVIGLAIALLGLPVYQWVKKREEQ